MCLQNLEKPLREKIRELTDWYDEPIQEENKVARDFFLTVKEARFRKELLDLLVVGYGRE